MTDEEIRAVRDATDLAGLVGEDVDLRARGSRQWACCPFHDERTPSFMVDEQTQRYRCFGCGAHGDAIDYVMQRRDLTFAEAVTLLADRAGIELTQGKGDRDRPSRGRLLEAVALAARHARSILADAGREDARKTRRWLTDHGIGEAAIERWGIGYAPGNGELCHALRDAGFTEREIRSSGMCHGRGDALYNVICVPVNNASGKVVGLAGQTVGEHGRAYVTGIPSSLRTTQAGTGGHGQAKVACHGTLLGLGEAREAIRSCGAAIVTLGPLDAVALHERGVRNAVSCMGGGLNAKAARALVTAGAQEITLLLPTTRQATSAARASLGAALSVPARLSLAHVKGDDALRAINELGVDGVGRLCEGAPELVTATLNDVIGSFDLDDPQGLVDAAARACDTFVTAVDGERASAGIVARQVAESLGIRDPTTLTHALLADGPVGRPETIPGIDPLIVENPRRHLPMAHVAIDLPAPSSPVTSLAEEAIGARIASNGLTVGTQTLHGREPPASHPRRE